MSAGPGGPWQAAYHPARAFWLQRGLYLLLACDTWLLMLEHGGRYGVGEFNVAHFAWLDHLIPLPTPPLYLGLVTSCGLLALSGALGCLPLPGRLVLCLCYTLAWAMSLHDSYQHHYLLSWMLAFAAFLPTLPAERCRDDRPVTGAALPLAALQCVVVYLFTAVSKLSPLWQGGAVLRHLARSPGPLAVFAGLVEGSALEPRVWPVFASALVALQLSIALAFLLSIYRDAQRTWLIVSFCWLGWGGSIAFHLMTEWESSFSIGWFSYYMLWVGLVLLAPSSWLGACLVPLAWSTARVKHWPFMNRTTATLLTAGSAGAAALVALCADLPGVAEAVCCVWFGVGAMAVLSSRGPTLPSFVRASWSLVVAVLALFAALSLGDVRFHYYRRLAGELARMGQLESALANYRQAERYAPSGQTRERQIRALERQLSEQRRQRHGQL